MSNDVASRETHGPRDPSGRPRILVVIDYYLPGFRGGGPIRTISNLVEHLGHVFEFWIVTGDRDLGDAVPYAGIRRDQWEAHGNAHVFYRSRERSGLSDWARLLHDTPHDALYLNSLYSRASMRILMLRRLGAIPLRPTIVAPRGELSPGAMNLKANRKSLFLTAAAALGCFRRIVWQASSVHEHADIDARLRQARVVAPTVSIATDLPPRRLPDTAPAPAKVKHRAAIAFVSRIARIKNLHFAIELLHHVRGQVSFDIFGPKEDEQYWSECAAAMAGLPSHVTARYGGDVNPSETVHVLAQYDLLLFPTISENFGYVILEALMAGCPVLTSDGTPWRSLPAQHAGWDVPLADRDRFVSTLQRVVDMDDQELRVWREGARGLAQSVIRDEEAVHANRRLFMDTLDSAR